MTWTSPGGTLIFEVCVKAGSASESGSNFGPYYYTSNGVGDANGVPCYTISGIGTNTATVIKTGSGPQCKDISHVVFYYKNAPKANVNISTVVFNATTNAAWAGTEQTGASAYDTSKVVAPTPILPTGTVTYSFYTNNTCAGDGTSAGTKNLTGGTVPVSDTKSTLPAGSYAFRATYNGDSHYNSKTSDCEPFTVAAPPSKANVNVSTIVFDASTDKALVDLKLAAGGSVYDTARVVAPSAIPVPTGTVTYIFYSTGNCVSANALGTDHSTVNLSAGNVPNSKTESDLTAGSYSFKAIYSGDTHYNGKSSACEPFTVTATSKDPTAVATQSSTTSDDVEAGTLVTDTATVTNTSGGATPTGTVQFKISFNGGAATTVGATKTVDATGKATSDAFTVTSQTAYGEYCWQAFFTATGNFQDSSGTAKTNECFSVSGPYHTPTPSPSGGVLAATGATPPTQDLAIFLIALGLVAMMGGAFAWRRREA